MHRVTVVVLSVCLLPQIYYIRHYTWKTRCQNSLWSFNFCCVAFTENASLSTGHCHLSRSPTTSWWPKETATINMKSVCLVIAPRTQPTCLKLIKLTGKLLASLVKLLTWHCTIAWLWLLCNQCSVHSCSCSINSQTCNINVLWSIVDFSYINTIDCSVHLHGGFCTIFTGLMMSLFTEAYTSSCIYSTNYCCVQLWFNKDTSKYCLTWVFPSATVFAHRTTCLTNRGPSSSLG